MKNGLAQAENESSGWHAGMQSSYLHEGEKGSSFLEAHRASRPTGGQGDAKALRRIRALPPQPLPSPHPLADYLRKFVGGIPKPDDGSRPTTHSRRSPSSVHDQRRGWRWGAWIIFLMLGLLFADFSFGI